MNLSFNPLSSACNKLSSSNSETDTNQLVIEYFGQAWKDLYFSIESPRSKTPITGPNLNTLIINSCFIDLRIVECILETLKNLNELHLSSNNYSNITFSSNFSHESLKILYFNNNELKSWNDAECLGECFPSLEILVIIFSILFFF